MPPPWLILVVALGFLQMGGPEGVAKSEVYTLVTGLKSPGMLMHAIPRPGVVVPPRSTCLGA